MLLELHIKNFALIDSVDLKFSGGLNILTGETGAGKSILIDSVNFIMGGKASKDIIRTGSESAYVEGVFDMGNDAELLATLSENGIDEDDVIIISREINTNGRSISRINGKTVTISCLKRIGKRLIDIHGQHEHQSLLDEGSHIDILDSFCNQEFYEIRDKYLEIFKSLKEIEEKINKLSLDEQYRLRRIDLLKYQTAEIKEASLKLKEDEELIRQRDILNNAEKIYTSLLSAYEVLYSSSESISAYDNIGKALVAVDGITKYDSKLLEYKDSMENIYYSLEDLIEKLRSYKESIDFDQESLNIIEERLEIINKLKMKYGKSIDEILNYYENSIKELEEMESGQELIDELSKKKQKLKKELFEYSKGMTKIRQKIGEKLQDSVEGELKYLGMEKAVFKVDIKETEDYNEKGNNCVEFLMTANIGEPLRPLSKIASGGELSRIMLAIKNVIADVDKIPTLIFDEIDTGISGRTAQCVAEKLALVSGKHQILCVTHLPQIASMADCHFKIEKIMDSNKTYTKVHTLSYEDQIRELARLLGGALVTDLTLSHSKEMKDMADEIKKKLN